MAFRRVKCQHPLQEGLCGRKVSLAEGRGSQRVERVHRPWVGPDCAVEGLKRLVSLPMALV